VKSLAGDQNQTGRGVGSLLVNAAVEKAKTLGVPKVFGLTLKPQFFEKIGFKVVDKGLLPMKVWSDCARCTKQQNCDETAVIKMLDGACCPIRQ
jgi:amino-acid N-acetyltransferase